MADLYDGTTPPKKCPHTGDLFGADSLPTERFTPVEGGQWELVLSRDDEEEEHQGISPLWMLAAAAAVGLIWFNTGLLGVQPALVSGQSMAPSYVVGDIIVTQDVDVDSLRVGDVIRYRSASGRSIFHRIIDVTGSGAGRVFITRGDNNNVNDPPVVAAQIDGRVVFKIPKIGWLPIRLGQGLRSLGG